MQVALLPSVKMPAAKHALGNGKWEAALLAADQLCDPEFATEHRPDARDRLDADADGHGHHAAMAQVASLGWQASDKLNLSAEFWGAGTGTRAGTTRQASADGSVAYLLSNDVQLDAGANFGLNRNTPDVELYGGISKRF